MKAELVRHMLPDLRKMIPERVTLTAFPDHLLIDDGTTEYRFTYNEDMSDCSFAQYVLDEVQVAVAHATGEYWPRIGAARLTYEIECVEGRPKVVFELE